MEPGRLRSAIRAAVAVGAAAAGLWWLAPPRDAAPSPSVPAPVASVPVAVAAAPMVTEPAASSPAPLAPCPHQHLDIVTADGVTTRSCVAATRTRQRGSVRSYQLDAEGTSTWRLVVDVADAKVRAVRLLPSSRPARPADTFSCAQGACAAVQIGRPDGHGARTMTIDDLGLRKAGETVRLSARLAIPPDAQTPGLACTMPAVRIVEEDGGLTEFCPMGGAGFELADDGRPRFQFRNLEGRSVEVALAADGTIERVAIGKWACSASQCGGLAMRVHGDPADPSAERHFSFSGLAVFEATKNRPAATLSGELVMPQQ